MSQHLFDNVHQIEDRVMQAEHVLLCLDYDGTLAHFTATPLGAKLSMQMERALLSLAEHTETTVAIISGRDRADLQARIGIPGLTYAGNHGLEISGPGFLFVEPKSAELVGALQELAGVLTDQLKGLAGCLVEYKGLTISVHYRQVSLAEWDEVRRLVHMSLASSQHPFVLSKGELVFEIRPRVHWNKGNAVAWIEEQLGSPGTLTIYVGDDTTDEDAFLALPEGISIKVGVTPTTAAQFSLAGPAEVRKLLEWMDDTLRHKVQREVEAPCGAA